MQELLEVKLFLKSCRRLVYHGFVTPILRELTTKAVDLIPAKARYQLTCYKLFLDCLDEVERFAGSC